MASEKQRVTVTKRITNPNNSSQFVDVPVISSIVFIDNNERHQEYEFTFGNGGDDYVGDREIHVDRVVDPNDNSASLDVERIDLFTTNDSADRHQEERFAPDSKTGANQTPPHFVTHVRTHVKRINGEGDNSECYVDTERIDEITFIDPNDRHQEKTFTLNTWDDEEQA